MKLKKITKLSTSLVLLLVFTMMFNPLAQAFSFNFNKFYSTPYLSLRANSKHLSFQYGNKFSLNYYRRYNTYNSYVDQYVLYTTPDGTDKFLTSSGKWTTRQTAYKSRFKVKYSKSGTLYSTRISSRQFSAGSYTFYSLYTKSGCKSITNKYCQVSNVAAIQVDFGIPAGYKAKSTIYERLSRIGASDPRSLALAGGLLHVIRRYYYGKIDSDLEMEVAKVLDKLDPKVLDKIVDGTMKYYDMIKQVGISPNIKNIVPPSIQKLGLYKPLTYAMFESEIESEYSAEMDVEYNELPADCDPNTDDTIRVYSMPDIKNIKLNNRWKLTKWQHVPGSMGICNSYSRPQCSAGSKCIDGVCQAPVIDTGNDFSDEFDLRSTEVAHPVLLHPFQPISIMGSNYFNSEYTEIWLNRIDRYGNTPAGEEYRVYPRELSVFPGDLGNPEFADLDLAEIRFNMPDLPAGRYEMIVAVSNVDNLEICNDPNGCEYDESLCYEHYYDRDECYKKNCKKYICENENGVNIRPQCFPTRLNENNVPIPNNTPVKYFTSEPIPIHVRAEGVYGYKISVKTDSIKAVDETNAWSGEIGDDEVFLTITPSQSRYLSSFTGFEDPTDDTRFVPDKKHIKYNKESFELDEGDTVNWSRVIFPVDDSREHRYLSPGLSQLYPVIAFENDTEDADDIANLSLAIFSLASSYFYFGPPEPYSKAGSGIIALIAIATSLSAELYSELCGKGEIIINDILEVNPYDIYDWTAGHMGQLCREEGYCEITPLANPDGFEINIKRDIESRTKFTEKRRYKASGPVSTYELNFTYMLE